MAVESTVLNSAVVPGVERRTRTEVKLDNSYKEGGEPLTAAELGLKRVDFAFGLVKNGSEAEATPVAAVAVYDPANSLLILNDYKTQKPLAKEKDTSKVVVIVYAWGV